MGEKREVVFVFDDDAAAEGFLVWLSDQGGDQSYWSAVEYNHKAPAVGFDYVKRGVYPAQDRCIPAGEPWVVLCETLEDEEEE